MVTCTGHWMCVAGLAGSDQMDLKKERLILRENRIVIISFNII